MWEFVFIFDCLIFTDNISLVKEFAMTYITLPANIGFAISNKRCMNLIIWYQKDIHKQGHKMCKDNASVIIPLLLEKTLSCPVRSTVQTKHDHIYVLGYSITMVHLYKLQFSAHQLYIYKVFPRQSITCNRQKYSWNHWTMLSSNSFLQWLMCEIILVYLKFHAIDINSEIMRWRVRVLSVVAGACASMLPATLTVNIMRQWPWSTAKSWFLNLSTHGWVHDHELKCKRFE